MGVGVLVGVGVGVGLDVGVDVAVAVGVGVGVGGTGVSVGGTEVDVGGTGVSVDGVGVPDDEVQFFKTNGRYRRASGLSPGGVYSTINLGVYELSRVPKLRQLEPRPETSGPRSMIPWFG
jgi:hypothetical protein